MSAVHKLSDHGVVLFSTRIPRSLHKRVRLEALEHGMNLSDWIRDALRAHLTRVKIETPEPMK